MKKGLKRAISIILIELLIIIWINIIPFYVYSWLINLSIINTKINSDILLLISLGEIFYLLIFIFLIPAPILFLISVEKDDSDLSTLGLLFPFISLVLFIITIIFTFGTVFIYYTITGFFIIPFLLLGIILNISMEKDSKTTKSQKFLRKISYYKNYKSENNKSLNNFYQINKNFSLNNNMHRNYKYCSNCGTKLRMKDKYCYKCGEYQWLY